jgi:DNA-binding SARP family transcriptional activator
MGAADQSQNPLSSSASSLPATPREICTSLCYQLVIGALASNQTLWQSLWAPTDPGIRSMENPPPLSPAAPSRLRLQFLGVPVLIRPSGAPLKLTAKDALLLATVAIDGPQFRDDLAARLWPNAGRNLTLTLNNLRQRLHQLNKEAGTSVMPYARTLQLAQGVCHDSPLLSEEKGVSDHALGLELLQGCECEDAPLAQAWLLLARQRWQRLRCDHLRSEVQTSVSLSRPQEALRLAMRWTRLDPWSEEAHRQVMTIYAARDERAEALQWFERYAGAQRNKLGLEPSAALQALAQRLRQGAVENESNEHAFSVLLRERLAHPPLLIGRQAALQTLRLAFAGHRLMVVLGEPGAGKTRLASEFVATRAKPLTATARWGDQAHPYAWLARLLRALFAGPNEMTTLSPSARQEFAHVDPRFGKVPTRTLNSVRLAHALRAAVAEYDLVWVDDLQFADSASLALLVLLATPGQGPRWLLGLRPREAPAEVLHWLAAHETQLARTELAPWQASDVLELLTCVDWPADTQRAWADKITQTTGGNPLFVLRALEAAAQAGLRPEQAVLLPASALALVQALLAHLPEDALALARVAALAAADFSLDLAASVLDRNPVFLATPWAALRDAQLLRDERLVHDLVAEALRQSTPQPVAEWMHLAIATALQRMGTAPAKVAPHWVKAGRFGQAARQFRAAAAEANGQALRDDEAHFLAQAAISFEKAGEHDERFAALADRLGALVQCAAALHPVAAAELLALVPALSPQQHAVALSSAAESFNARAEFVWVLKNLPTAISLAHTVGDVETEVVATRRLAFALVNSGQQAKGAALLVEAAQRLVPGLRPAAQAEFLGDLGTVLADTGQRAKAAAVQQRAIAAAMLVGHIDDAMTCRANLAINRYFMGHLQAAITTIEELLAMPKHDAETGGLILGVELSYGQMLRDQGRYAEALQRMQRVLDAGNQAGNALWRVHAENNLAMLWLTLAQPARARQLTKSNASQDLPPFLQATRYLLQAQTAAALHQPSLPLLDQGLQILQLGGRDDVRFRLMAARGAHLAPEIALQEAQSWGLQAQAQQLHGLAAWAQVCQVQALQRNGLVQAAAAQAHSALAALNFAQPMAVYMPDLWAALAEVFGAAAQPDAARAVLATAEGWIRAAAHHTPAQLLPGYVERNPAHNRLKRLATKLDLAGYLSTVAQPPESP